MDILRSTDHRRHAVVPVLHPHRIQNAECGRLCSDKASAHTESDFVNEEWVPGPQPLNRTFCGVVEVYPPEIGDFLPESGIGFV